MNTPKLARQLSSSSLSSPSSSSSSLSSASSFKVSGFLSSVRGLTEKVGVVSGLAGSMRLQEKVAKAQSVISKVSQGQVLAEGVIRRVQHWGEMKSLNKGLSVEQGDFSAMLGLGKERLTGLHFTLSCLSLAPNTFVVTSFDFRSSYSQVFSLQVETRSREPSIEAGQVLDNEARLGIWREGKLLREVGGLVSRFERGDSGFRQTVYRLEIVPPLWRLGLSTNSRVFQGKDIETIVTTILKTNGVVSYRFALREPHRAREYCVQYRETDLAFLERLLAEEGIYYYVDGEGVLVLSDDGETLKASSETNSSPTSAASSEEAASSSSPSPFSVVPLRYTPHDQAQLKSENVVTRFGLRERVRVSHTVLRDYTFKKPLWQAEYRAEAKREGGKARYEHYDFPGRFKDSRGEVYSRYRLGSLQRDSEVGEGESNSAQLLPGVLVQLSAHPTAAWNSLWQVTAVHYIGRQPQGAEQEAGEGATTLSCQFQVIAHSQTWRPMQQTKPIVEGPQMAIVTGPKGEEIYTDQYGRIRVQFLWDRVGQFNQKSGCWVRVTQPWSGKGWGMMAIPRVGHEVLVDFLEGDPDQPIVTGRTYHANMPLPAKLPQHKTQMHLMSQTYKGGGYNGLMMEDEAGQERLDFHAQKDMNTLVLNDRTTNVGGNHQESVKGEQKVSVNAGRYKEVGGEERVAVGQSQLVKVGGNYQLTVNNEVMLKSNVESVTFETAGSMLTMLSEGYIELKGQEIVVNGQVLELNPGGGSVANGESSTAPAVSGDSELSLVPPAGAIVDGAEEFGKRGENLMKSTTPLKSTGEHKYYDNGWQGNQHVKTDNVFNKKVMKQIVEKAPVVGGVLDTIEVVEGMKNDGWSIGKNTVQEISGVAGSWAGAAGGGVVGAAIGSAIFPGIGTVIGGAIGAIGGSWGGEELFEQSVDWIWEEGK